MFTSNFMLRVAAAAGELSALSASSTRCARRARSYTRGRVSHARSVASLGSGDAPSIECDVGRSRRLVSSLAGGRLWRRETGKRRYNKLFFFYII